LVAVNVTEWGPSASGAPAAIDWLTTIPAPLPAASVTWLVRSGIGAVVWPLTRTSVGDGTETITGTGTTVTVPVLLAAAPWLLVAVKVTVVRPMGNGVAGAI